MYSAPLLVLLEVQIISLAVYSTVLRSMWQAISNNDKFKVHNYVLGLSFFFFFYLRCSEMISVALSFFDNPRSAFIYTEVNYKTSAFFR